MDLKSGYPFWQVHDGLIASYPPLERDVSRDVAVIGGGITGALVAHALTDAGIPAVLLDRREIGWGSTSATTALIQYELDVPLHRLARTIGEERAVRSYHACRRAVETLGELVAGLDDPADFQSLPSLYLASRPRDVPALERECEWRRRGGFEVELWSGGRIAEEFSFRRAAALFTEPAGQVNPYRLTHALLRRAAGRGLLVHDRTAVRSVRRVRGGGGFRLGTDRGAEIRARRVVFATGYETGEWLRVPGVKLRSTYAVVSEPVDRFEGWGRPCLIWETARPYTYLRTTADGRVIVGGLDDAGDDPALRDRRVPRKAAGLTRRVRALFPRMGFEPAFAWAGTFAETADGLPYIGEHREHPGAYFAMCYGGNGITFGVVAAALARDAVLGCPHPDAELFGFDR